MHMLFPNFDIKKKRPVVQVNYSESGSDFAAESAAAVPSESQSFAKSTHFTIQQVWGWALVGSWFVLCQQKIIYVWTV